MAPTYKSLANLIAFSFRFRWGWRAAVLLISLTGALAGLGAPVFQKVFVDQLMGAKSVDIERLGLNALHSLTPIEAIFYAFIFALFSQALMLLANFLAVREGAILQKFLSEDLYRKMLSIRPDSLGQTTVGEVVSIYATDVAGSTAAVDQALPMAASIVFHIVFAPLAVYWITGIPLWATLTVMAIVSSLTIAMATRQSRFFTRFKQLAADRTGIVNEWVQTIRLLRVLGWVESIEAKIFAKRREETRNRVRMVTNGQLMNSFGSSINFVINIVAIASLIYLRGESVTPGELFAMLWIFGVFLSRSFRQLPWLFTFLFDSVTSMRRLQQFMARPSDAGSIEPAAIEKRFIATALDLKVEGLSLKIGGETILDDLTFSVKQGEFIAVVGEVGSGKSTLLLSLVGEMGATFKRLEIGGVDALNLDVNVRREAFAFVPQEGFAMSATLRENIVFRYEAGPEDDQRAIRSLEVSQIRLSEIQGPGLLTEIGERGVNLSGGQRQRVSLARAHQFDRPIILLDDCLSAVDVDTERGLVGGLLQGEWKHKTRLLVTHRLSVLNHVDRILLLQGGRIIESGSYAELMKRSPEMQSFVASLEAEEKAHRDSSGIIEPTTQGKEAQNEADKLGQIDAHVELGSSEVDPEIKSLS